MNRQIVLSKYFDKCIKTYISKNKIFAKDFESLKKELIENPEMGDLVPGTGGMRKIRLKSTSKGKSGGFRIYYLDSPIKKKLFLADIYPKNEKENLSAEEKKILKDISIKLKSKD